jgi:hypothetical protein
MAFSNLESVCETFESTRSEIDSLASIMRLKEQSGNRLDDLMETLVEKDFRGLGNLARGH